MKTKTLALLLGVLALPLVASGAQAAPYHDWRGQYVSLQWLHASSGATQLAFAPDGTGDTAFGGSAGLGNSTGGTVHQELRGNGLGLAYTKLWQRDRLVVGLEGSVAWPELSATTHSNFGGGTTPVTQKTSLSWMLALTPKLGIALGNWLPYVKTGPVLAGVSSKLAGAAYGQPETFSANGLHKGWLTGFGVDYAPAWPHSGKWVVGLEYDDAQFSSVNHGGMANPDNTWPVDYSVKPSFHSWTMHVAYRF